MGFVENFTNISSSNVSTSRKNELYKILFSVLLVKLLFIYIAAYFVWPWIIPQLFPNVKSNPTFLQLLGFSILIGLII